MIDPDAVEQDAMISDQASVAPPPEGLAAHDHSAFTCCRVDDLAERREKFSRPHVGGVSPEGFVAERNVGRILRKFTEATQPLLPAVRNTGSGQPLFEMLTAEVWKFAASRGDPNVDEARYFRSLKALLELTLGSGSVPHGV
jgi:hypothetical protein